jgi:hypothetical protein
MLEKLVLRRDESGAGIGLGDLAEALLFYQKVHLVLDMGSLGTLIRRLGATNLLRLLRERHLTAVYSEDALAAQQQDFSHVVQHHSFIAFFLSGSKTEGLKKSRAARFELMLEKHGLSGNEARRFTKSFLVLLC